MAFQAHFFNIPFIGHEEKIWETIEILKLHTSEKNRKTRL